MGPPRKRRRSGLLDVLKGVTRHGSKHNHRIDKVVEGSPARVITPNNMIHPVTILPIRQPTPRASVFKPRRMNVNPKDTHAWSYWGPTKNLSAGNLEALMRRHCYEMTGASWDPQFRFEYQIAGSHNTVYVMESTVGSKVKICVRVPAWGWVERWNETDAEMLRAGALSMRLVRERSEVPVPEVLAYDMTMENELGAPYIIMTFLEGVGAEQVWDGLSNDEASQIEEKRQKILRSLARTMSSLDKTKFAELGTLWFPNYQDDTQSRLGLAGN